MDKIVKLIEPGYRLAINQAWWILAIVAGVALFWHGVPESVLVAMLRKSMNAALIIVFFKLLDIFSFKAFDTDEVIKNDPRAIAQLLGAIAIALALA